MGRSRVEKFAHSISDLERFRTVQIENLKKTMNIRYLPKRIALCDPDILPIVNPKIRALCKCYPEQAEKIVAKYGLHYDDFNHMIDDIKKYPLLRWKVKKIMKKIHKRI